MSPTELLPVVEKPVSEVHNYITPEVGVPAGSWAYLAKQPAGVAIRLCHDLRVGAVAAVAAVGTDELAMEAVHFRATDLAVLTRRPQYFGGLRLLCALFVHILEYTATASP
jgi:hypothetical protein